MRKRWLFGGLMILLLALTGCGTKKEYDISLETNYDNAIVLCGNHSNNVKPDYSMIEEPIKNVALNYGEISLICIDGKPYVAKSISIPKQKNGLSSSKKESIAYSQVSQIVEFMNSDECMAKTDEVNCFKCFEIASRITNSSSHKNKRNAIYVFDSGISTSGLVNFCDVSLDINQIDEVMNILKENMMIYDLAGVDIYWYGIGDVSEPQDELSTAQKEFLKSIWKEYLTQSGANVYFMTDICTDYFNVELPSVTPILSITPAVEWNKSEGETSFPELVAFDEEILGFRSGSAELINESEAICSLEKTADYLRANPDAKIIVVGCTAQWGSLEDYCKPLSLSRSEVVRDLLVKQGVDEERIQTYGMGFDNPFYKNDLNESGELIESVAKTNRCIVILDLNSEIGQKIINDSWR